MSHEKRHQRFELTLVGTDRHKERTEEDEVRVEHFWSDVVNATVEFDRAVTSEMFYHIPVAEEEEIRILKELLDEFFSQFGSDLERPTDASSLYRIEHYLSRSMIQSLMCCYTIMCIFRRFFLRF